MQEKRIVLGVTGGIAAYKAVEIVSRLKKEGADVQVIMTQAAAQFVTPLTFREMSGNPVIVTMWEEPKRWNVEHIALASWADLFLIAPATANIIGKIANGIADDMLSTTVMATTAPVVFAPAMNTNMYRNAIVQQNITKLSNLGYRFLEPGYGRMACGTEGPGRLPEPAEIVRQVIRFLAPAATILAGKKVLVTAGGTREPIDPVRYIGNRSSGKMGYALAVKAAQMAAKVVLIAGPTSLPDPPGVCVKKVETAAQMRQAVLAEYDDSDLVIKAAAVADYRPQLASPQKIKKSEEQLTLTLEKNPDILRELGAKKTHQFLVGFAAETENLLEYATEKLQKKNLDMLVANDVTLPGAGFNADTNIVKLLYRDGHREELPQMTKIELAEKILAKICEHISK
ncbi:bifunctional phosphopantothenoylcysteine decarboxylase/phosphopantothenate--cysteine ligase CoaBC [Lucifera butyrica]|uniref:bifunctional phosphopantothenoylcysteine decarboxylase/phosphopantothenate--cysteine ligase CoaBC n=1 Tax=Lucifera butyrica TaxID=1351585 RepID=UPI001A9CCBB1|nr:bifunctional phosphopantothenoylcysteine decarboxylase/phosphopantothenate--cysteine ligase CoaBC [Lucifera butyrica]